MNLTAAHRHDWAAAGRVVLVNVLDQSVLAELDAAVHEVEAWSHTDGPGMHHFELTDTGPQLARSEDFDPYHERLSAFLRRGVVSAVLAELFGEPATLFKEKINYKHPGGAGFAPHQDITAYRNGHLAKIERHISVMVPLDSSTVASGCLFFSDAARNEILPNAAGRIDPDWVRGAEWHPVEVGPGDLVFFDSYAPHHSGTNMSEASRRVMYLTYNRAADGDLRDDYYADKREVIAAAGPDGERARISVNDDFLGRPIPANQRGAAELFKPMKPSRQR